MNNREYLVVTVVGCTCLVCAPGTEEHKIEFPFESKEEVIKRYEDKGWNNLNCEYSVGYVQKEFEVLVLTFVREVS